MRRFRLAGQDFYSPFLVPELAPFEITGTQPGTASSAVPFVSDSFHLDGSAAVPAALALTCQAVGWVADAERPVEIWSAPPGTLLRVAGGSDFYIAPGGQAAFFANSAQSEDRLNETDRQILLGPVLVLALALRGTWCLHASAAIFKENLVVFLGESRQGKSTLAAALAAAGHPGWRLVADDILPVTMNSGGMTAWTRFPQLKLPVDAQPGIRLPEQVPISKVCVLSNAGLKEKPALQLLPASQSVQVLLGHTAGARLFDAELLAKHLAFCTRAAGQHPVYRLNYPHRWDVLPGVQELLENLC
jgi:hypothetical protein